MLPIIYSILQNDFSRHRFRRRTFNYCRRHRLIYSRSACKGKMKGVVEFVDEKEEANKGCERVNADVHHGVCAICLDKIVLEETALVKGCEHAYCVTCILQWASYHEHPKCPQCKNPFEFLSIHRSLDGRLHDYMFEESVCLLLRASWFEPLVVYHREDFYDEVEELYHYQYEYEYEEEDDLAEDYFNCSASVCIGNRRWGYNGYIRSGRQEARPICHSGSNNAQYSSGAGSSREPKKKVSKEVLGRRAKRALKREAEDKAAAAKHQQHLARLGRK